MRISLHARGARLLILLAMFWGVSVTSMAAWDVTTVGSFPYFRPGYESAFVDGHGYRHVFYGGLHLYHAYEDAGGWHTEVVDPNAQVGLYASAIMDHDGVFHVVYWDSISEVARYATNRGGKWGREVLPYAFDPSFHGGGLGRLAVGPDNALYMAYFKDTGNRRSIGILKAVNGRWDEHTADVLDKNRSLGSGYLTVDMAVDSAGVIHLLYPYSTVNVISSKVELWYASYENGIRQQELIEGQPVGDDCYSCFYHYTLTLDRNEIVSIAYLGNNPAWGTALIYAQRIGGAWIKQVVDDENRAGRFPSLVFDSENAPHLAYGLVTWSSAEPVPIRYAHLMDGGWDIVDVVTPAGIALFPLMLLIGADDTPSMVYFDLLPDGIHRPQDYNSAHLNFLEDLNGSRAKTVLDVSVENTPSPLPEGVDPIASGIEPAVTVDSTGAVHACYFEGKYSRTSTEQFAHKFRLIYATNASGEWVTETIARFSSYEQEKCAITVTPDGPQIFLRQYWTFTHYTKVNAFWAGTVVDTRLVLPFHYDGDLHLDIKADAFGNLYATYAGASQIRFATNRSGNWVVESVASLGDEWGSMSDYSPYLSVNGTRIDITYLDRNRRLMQARRTATGWTRSAVASAAWDEYWHLVASAVDSRGHVHMAYERLVRYADFYVYNGVWYGTNASGHWNVSPVDRWVAGWIKPGERADIRLSLALDKRDGVHVSYYRYVGTPLSRYTLDVARRLYYAKKVGTDWVSRSVDWNTQAAGASAVAVSGNGVPVVGYLDTTGLAFKTASWVVPAAPSALTPSSGISMPQPLYRWTAVAGVARYRLGATDAAGIKQRVVVSADVAGCGAAGQICSYRAPFAPRRGTWNWSVTGVDVIGIGTNSNLVAFTMLPPEPPTLIASTALTPASVKAATFRWLPSPQATSYTLYLRSMRGPTLSRRFTAKQLECGRGRCVAHVKDLPTKGLWNWYVRASNAIGASNWSDAGQIRLR